MAPLKLPFWTYQGVTKKKVDVIVGLALTYVEAKQKRRAQAAVGVVEIVEQKAIAKEATTTIQAEAYAKVMDDTIVHGVLIDLTNTSVIEETRRPSWNIPWKIAFTKVKKHMVLSILRI